VDREGDDGFRESGLDSGEGALKTATTSKEGSRRANYPMFKERGSDGKYKYRRSLKPFVI